MERVEVLKEAYSLADKVLLVSSMLDISSNNPISCRLFGDGHITSRNTFQKLYTQSELREFIIQSLDVDPVSAGPGIFYVFKDDSEKEGFLVNRTRRHVEFFSRPRLFIADKYEKNRELLEDFIQTIYKLGRTPKEEEYPRSVEIIERIGSFRKAFAIVQHRFPDHQIELYRQRRYEDLLVYLALTYFRKLPRLDSLPITTRNDVEAFFGTYQRAKHIGKELLFSAGNTEKVISECRESKIGKKLPDDLYVHRSFIDRLSPLLRVYYGCAESFIGDIEDVDVIKFHMKSGKLSYLRYENFDRKAHPRLLNVTTVMLRKQNVRFLDYSDRDNPPILHRKETMVDTDYPHYNKFRKLTEAEDKAGLLQKGEKGFGLLKLWEERLAENGFEIKGHKLIKRKGRSP